MKIVIELDPEQEQKVVQSTVNNVYPQESRYHQICQVDKEGVDVSVEDNDLDGTDRERIRLRTEGWLRENVLR